MRAEPAEVDRLLWELRTHAHYNGTGFSGYSSHTVKTTKSDRDKGLCEVTKRGKALAKESRINRKAWGIAHEIHEEQAVA